MIRQKFSAGIAVSLGLAGTLWGQTPGLPLQPVVLSRQQTGSANSYFMDDGFRFTAPPIGPIVFNARFSFAPGGSEEAGSGWWTVGTSPVSAQVLTTTPVPGLPNLHFQSFGDARFFATPSGDTVFSASMYSGTSSQLAEFQRRGGQLSIIARDGSQAPGLANGVQFGQGPTQLFGVDDSGRALFSYFLTGTGVFNGNHVALWVNEAAGPRMLARLDDPLPGVPGATVIGLSNAMITPSGTVYFEARTGSTDYGIFSDDHGLRGSFARTGEVAPGTDGATFLSVGLSGASHGGSVAVGGRLTGGTVNSTNEYGVWVQRAGPGEVLSLAVRMGDTVPGGPGWRVAVPQPIGSNASGQVLFFGYVGATPQMRQALCITEPTGIRVVARQGDARPDGMPWVRPSSAGMNALGQVAFVDQYVNGDTQRFAVFAFDPGAGLIRVVAPGDLITIAPGDVRTVRTAFLGDEAGLLGFSSDTGTGLQDNGRLYCTLVFTDNTRGIFSTIVPGPTTAALVGLAFMLGTRPRSQRRPRTVAA